MCRSQTVTIVFSSHYQMNEAPNTTQTPKKHTQLKLIQGRIHLASFLCPSFKEFADHPQKVGFTFNPAFLCLFYMSKFPILKFEGNNE